MKINMTSKDGVTLLTKGKYCTEDIEVTPTFETGGGGNDSVVEVDELPTENIDESKIYVVNKTETTVQAYMCMEGAIINFADMGTTVVVVKNISEIETPKENTCYIEEDTGYTYMLVDGAVVKYAEFMISAGMPAVDYGWVNKLPEAGTEAWLCSMKIENQSISIGVPNEEQDKGCYIWNGQSWQGLTMPFEIDQIASLGEGVAFKLGGGMFVLKFTDESVESISQPSGDWFYTKHTKHTIKNQNYNSASLSTATTENFEIMVKVGNNFAIPNQYVTNGNEITKAIDYIGYALSRDLTKCYGIDGTTIAGGSEKITLEEWNSILAELNITET